MDSSCAPRLGGLGIGYRLLGVFITLCVWSHAEAADRFWNSFFGGSFNAAANWQGGFIPGSGDVAHFGRTTNPNVMQLIYTVDFDVSPTNQALKIEDDFVTFDLNGRTYTTTQLVGNEIGNIAGRTGKLTVTDGIWNVDTANDEVYISAVASASGSLTVSTGGQLTGSPRLFVGLLGTGTFTVQSGGFVQANFVSIGQNIVAIGTVDVTGAGSTLNTSDVSVGQFGTGTLNITAGGTVQNSFGAAVGNFADATGTVHVDGANSRWINSGQLAVGHRGDGTMSVTATAQVQNSDGFIGLSAGGIGMVTVAGGATWTNTGNLFVGEGGEGTLSIEAGGSVSSATAVIGNLAGSVGTVTVDGTDSVWTNSSFFRVGNAGQGSLTVTGGGMVSSGGAEIDGTDSITGSVTVDGTGSMWTSGGNLDVGDSGDATLTISGGGVVRSGSGVLADADVSHGFATITGAGSRWEMNDGSGTLYVGEDGTGTLNILDGGAVSNVDSFIGFDPGSTGTALVSGAGSTWTTLGVVSVATEGEGELTIVDAGSVSSGSGTIGEQAGSSGVAMVSGVGSIWTSSASITVGNSGTGALTIESGGDVSNLHGGIIAVNSGSSGTVTVTGAGSTWTNTTNLRVGHFGTGSLTIEAGGSVSNLHGVVGDFAGSNGTAIVRGAGSTWTNTANLLVAHSTTGALTIEAGGTVSNVDGTIGHDTGSMGTVTVTGAGSTWANTGELMIGNEDTGTGTLTIAAGGNVSNSNGTMGVDANASGAVTVTGTGSTWINNGDLTIGLNGAGELAVEDGGSVSNNIGVLAFGAGSTGTANVTGAGSNWTSDSFLIVGVEGAGDLTIAGGGSVSNTIGEIGRFPGSTGTALVTGAGSTWTNSGALAVADEGTGTLTIQAGGHVSNTNAVIGFATGSSGVATVSGTGSTWTTSGKLGLGGDATTLTNGGSGTLKIQSGATVNVAQGLVLFPNGKLKLEGGTLDTSSVSFQGGGEFSFFDGSLHVGVFNGSLVNQGGALAPGHSAGSTTIIGNYTQQAGATLDIEIGGTSAGGTYDLVGITGIAILGGELQISMLNGFVPTPSNTFTVLNSAGGIFGVLSNVTTGQRLATSDGNGSFIVNYGPGSAFNQNQIVLSAFQTPELPGDFNLDGKVDAADYVKWRKGLGTNYTPAHLNVWRANFGAMAGSGIGSLEAQTSNAIVPEPGSLILILVGANVVQVRRWRFAPLSAI